MSREYHERVKIVRCELETPDIVSLEFDCFMDAEPGQFVMACIPDIGERPISLCWDNLVEIAVKKVGKVTERMFDMKVGDEIYLRGPYGRPFPIPNESVPIYLIGGGCGIAPLNFLAIRAENQNKSVFIGAKTGDDILYYTRFLVDDDYCLGDSLCFATEDGSIGKKGLVTDLFNEKIIKKDARFYICGPEKMMVAAAERALEYTNAKNIYLSTERYMKCGRGICGSCELDGYRTCVDGPVFSYDQLIGGDFGCRKREKSGKRVEI